MQLLKMMKLILDYLFDIVENYLLMGHLPQLLLNNLVHLLVMHFLQHHQKVKD
jgi:hypothetical protein